MSLISKLFGPKGDHSDDDPKLIQENISSGKAVMLDVRGQDEWDEGHLKNAIFIPITTLKSLNNATTVVEGLDKTKIVYCH